MLVRKKTWTIYLLTMCTMLFPVSLQGIEPQPGDLLFVEYEGVTPIPGWDHVGMVSYDNKVIQSTPGRGVNHLQSVDGFLSQTHHGSIELLRVVGDGVTDAIRHDAVDFAESQIDKLYCSPVPLCLGAKNIFNDTYYCSELIWAAYHVATGAHKEIHCFNIAGEDSELEPPCPPDYPFEVEVTIDGWLDLDSGGFPGGVSPQEIYNSKWTSLLERYEGLFAMGKIYDEEVQGEKNLSVATGDFSGDGTYEVVVSWEGGGENLNTKIYDVTSDFEPIPKGKIYDEELRGKKNLSVATGDFDGDGIYEVVVAWEADDSNLNIKIYDVTADFQLIPKGKISDEGVRGDKQLSLATGDFDGDGKDEIVVSWEGGSGKLNTKIYDVTSELQLNPEGKIYDEGVRGNGHLSVAAGDFDGDGKDEVVVSWVGAGPVPGTPPYNLNTKIYDVSAALDLTAKGKISDEHLWGNQNLSIATGDFDGDGKDEVVVSWEGAGPVPGIAPYNLNTKIYDVSAALGLTVKGKISDEHLWGNRNLSVATGDFDGDGKDEVVVSWEGAGPVPGIAPYNLNTKTYDVSAALELLHDRKSSDERVHGKENLALATADFDGHGKDEIVVSWEGADSYLNTKIYLAYPPHYLHGDVYDGCGGPLVAETPYYLVIDDVTVPDGEILTIYPGVEVYFKSGCKIIANGILKINGTLDNPIWLISEDAPHCGIKLTGDMILTNGGYLEPGL